MSAHDRACGALYSLFHDLYVPFVTRPKGATLSPKSIFLMDTSLEAAARVVQLALTPVFLLSATATLLGVFATRLARVADRVDSLSREADDPERDRLLAVLRLRSRVLDTAVVLSALSGGLTCVTVLVLFLSELRGTGAARYLFLSFGAAICLTMMALGAFVMEMLLSARVIRLTVDRNAHKL